MSGTIVGKVRELSIRYDKGDKYFYGQTTVIGTELIYEIFDPSNLEDLESVEGSVHIYRQHSEELRNHLTICGKRNDQLILTEYTKTTSLTRMERHGQRLSFDIMLQTKDFDYFATFIESNFCTDLEYLINLPFLGFPVDAKAQAGVRESHSLILPTKAEFQSGEPCLFPNEGIPFVFRHGRSDE